MISLDALVSFGPQGGERLCSFSAPNAHRDEERICIGRYALFMQIEPCQRRTPTRFTRKVGA